MSEPVFRSSTRLREILDSKPIQRVPRRLASLASNQKSQSKSSSTEEGLSSANDGDIDRVEQAEFGAATQEEANSHRLNPHLSVPKGLSGREPVFLPWSGLIAESRAKTCSLWRAGANTGQSR